jgi:hypothetical protein
MTPGPPRPSIVRSAAGYGAIVCAFPYLAPRLVWLTGGTVGVANPALMRDSTMTILNAVTATMDVIAMLDDVDYRDLGADHFDRTDRGRAARR